MSLYNMLIGQDDYINQNVNRARSQYDAEIGNTIRTAGRMGINPNSGAFLNMLNNAQYERTAGLNAVGNDASYNYLKMAQNQFNSDRDFAFKQKAFDAAQNRYWTDRMDALNNLDFQRSSELAALREKNKTLQERMDQKSYQRMFGASPFTRGASMMDAFADNYYSR